MYKSVHQSPPLLVDAIDFTEMWNMYAGSLVCYTRCHAEIHFLSEWRTTSLLIHTATLSTLPLIKLQPSIKGLQDMHIFGSIFKSCAFCLRSFSDTRHFSWQFNLKPGAIFIRMILAYGFFIQKWIKCYRFSPFESWILKLIIFPNEIEWNFLSHVHFLTTKKMIIKLFQSKLNGLPDWNLHAERLIFIFVYL